MQHCDEGFLGPNVVQTRQEPRESSKSSWCVLQNSLGQGLGSIGLSQLTVSRGAAASSFPCPQPEGGPLC